MTTEGEVVGAVLRANGRYSITHRFITGLSGPELDAALRAVGIATACGLQYEPGEIYQPNEDDDDPDASAFLLSDQASAILACEECFTDGRARVVAG